MSELLALCLMQSPKCVSTESVGNVLPNYELKVIDLKNDEVLGPNQPGELCIKALWKMVGYLNNESATKAVIDDVEKKEMIRVAGHHVSPAEIEEKLLNHPGVMEVVVVAGSHRLYKETPVALVKKNQEMKVTEEELIKLSSELGTYKTVTHVKFLDELPKTPTSKMNRKMAKEIAMRI